MKSYQRIGFGCMKARRVFLIACCLAILSVNAVLGQTVDKKRLKDISFDDIKFDIVKGAPFKRSMLTKEIEAMDGQLIRVRGYMLPSFQQSGIKKFVLVRDNMNAVLDLEQRYLIVLLSKCKVPLRHLFQCVH